MDGQRGSIHALARTLRKGPANGWELWYYWDESAHERQPIEKLRAAYRAQLREE